MESQRQSMDRHQSPIGTIMKDIIAFRLRAWQEGKCDGVVTYCLEKQPGSRTFDVARDLFGQYRPARFGR